MFKSRIPLQTPIVIKLLLSVGLIIFFSGWFLSSEASSQEFAAKNSTIALKSKSQKNYTKQELAQIAKLTHQQINEYRASLNLAPLKFNALISEQAKAHSSDMAQSKVNFSHNGFEARANALKNGISYSSVAENLAYNMGYQDPVDTAVAGWIKSDGHRKNIEGNYNLTGIGVAVNGNGEYYFTQIFVLEN